MEMAEFVAVLRVEEKTSSSTRKSVTQHYQRFTFFFAQMLGNFQEKIEQKPCEMATEKRATWTPFGSQLNGVTSSG